MTCRDRTYKLFRLAGWSALSRHRDYECDFSSAERKLLRSVYIYMFIYKYIYKYIYTHTYRVVRNRRAYTGSYYTLNDATYCLQFFDCRYMYTCVYGGFSWVYICLYTHEKPPSVPHCHCTLYPGADPLEDHLATLGPTLPLG